MCVPGLPRTTRPSTDEGAAVRPRSALDPPENIEGPQAPPEVVGALGTGRVARAAYDAFPPGRRRRHVLDVEGAEQPVTRARRAADASAPHCPSPHVEGAPR